MATQPVANSWWSANGGIFAFVGVKPGGDLKVYLQSPRGNALRAVTPALADRQFAITAGGDRTAAIPAAADKIHLFEATGKDLGELRGAEKGELPVRFAGGKFFRRGAMGAWRDELSEEQVARIEAAHAAMMRRLGYELSTTVALARTA